MKPSDSERVLSLSPNKKGEAKRNRKGKNDSRKRGSRNYLKSTHSPWGEDLRASSGHH